LWDGGATFSNRAVPARDLITFPSGVLGVDPVRLPVLGQGDGWLAFSKPADMAFGKDVFSPASPDLLPALQEAVAAQKPQLISLGIAHVGRVHPVETAASGVVVFATNPKAETRLRNAVGSRQWEFVYDLLAQQTSSDAPVALTCDLPLVRHATEPRMTVSHATGKKCETVFTPLHSFGRWTRWEARSAENRPHQVRVHAWECGLHVPGDGLYGRVPRVYLSQIKRRYRPGRRDERPLHPSLCLHLREIAFPEAGGQMVRIECARPKTLEVMQRRLEEAAGTRAPAG